MTPLVLALAGVALILLMFLVVNVNDYRNLSNKYASEGDWARNQYKELREKYITILETGNIREALLKRALEDLASSEIDRARFVLEIVYGKTAKKS